MNVFILMRLALRSLIKHKGRNIIAVIGIVIGISTIIATLGIGRGMLQKQQQKFNSMGKNIISIQAHNWMLRGKVKKTSLKKQKLFTYDDIRVIKKQCSNLELISPLTSNRAVVSYEGTNLETEIKAGHADLLKIFDREIAKGVDFCPHHILHSEPVVILGNKVSKELFGSQQPIGTTVTINKTHFRVIGVLQSMPNFFGAVDPNLDVFMPITTLHHKLRFGIKDSFLFIAASAKSREAMSSLAREMTSILRISRNLSPEDSNDFIVYDQEAICKAASDSMGILNLFLLIIASISLFVAGVGVANIMLVCVTERTREIGIYKALGAPNKLILHQFLLEAIILCLSGGFGGISVGIGVTYLIGYIAGWPVIITLGSVLGSCTITAAIGIFFGYYPALRASRLDPIKALAEV